MTATLAKPIPIAALALITALTLGCQQQAPTESAADHGHSHGHEHGHTHDHHNRPTSLHAAVSELKEIRETVGAAMENGSPDDAHGALHDVGALLEVLPEIAADTDLPREKWEEAKAQNDKLFDAFGVIDKAFHTAGGDKVAAHAQVSAEIDEAIAGLEALLPLAGEKVSEADDHSDHDHGDHDHADHDHGDHAHEHDHADHDHADHDHAEHDHSEHDHDHEHQHEHGHEHGDEHKHEH